MTETACSHHRLRYDPIDHGDGGHSESWACAYCSMHFLIIDHVKMATMFMDLGHATRIKQLAESYIACSENLGGPGISDAELDALVLAETDAYMALLNAVRPPMPERMPLDDTTDNAYPVTGEP